VGAAGVEVVRCRQPAAAAAALPVPVPSAWSDASPSVSMAAAARPRVRAAEPDRSARDGGSRGGRAGAVSGGTVAMARGWPWTGVAMARDGGGDGAGWGSDGAGWGVATARDFLVSVGYLENLGFRRETWKNSLQKIFGRGLRKFL
jgi:hypothetical protein